MLRLAGIDASPAVALADGRALQRYRAMIAEQGGDPDAGLARAAVTATVAAPETGWLRRLDARAVGVAAWRLGAGRARKEDPVSAAAGVLCLAKPGERVEAGQPVLELRADTESVLAGARAALAGAIEVGDEPPPAPLVIERIGLPGPGPRCATRAGHAVSPGSVYPPVRYQAPAATPAQALEHDKDPICDPSSGRPRRRK
jgi:thymidine phosphorylase